MHPRRTRAARSLPSLRATRLATQLYPFLPWITRIPKLFGTTEEIPPDDNSIMDAHGIRVRLRPDPMWGTLWRQRLYEPFTTKVFRRIVRRGDVVFDVGTNFGWFAALFAKWVGSRGRVHAFEPVPFIAEMAAETLSLSSLDRRVTLNCTGLGAAPGSFTVYTFDGLPLGHASASDLGRADAKPHECRITTLDEYVRAHDVRRVDFIKVDAEGHELDVLRGGRELLMRSDAPVVYFETNSDCLNHRGITAQQIMDLLRAAGYTEFFTFSIRSGFERRDSLPDNSNGDHLAFKESHMDRQRRALSTRRFLRW